MALFLLSSLFIALIHCYDDFSNPPPFDVVNKYTANYIWQLGSIQQIQWSTGIPNYTMRLWQQDLVHNAAYPGKTIFSRAPTDPNSNQFSWEVSLYNFNISYSNVYFLGVNFDNPDPNAESFTSHYFNVTDKYVAPTSSVVSSTASASSTTSSTTSSKTATALSPTAQSSVRPKRNQVGLAVGLTIGLGIIVIIAGFIALKIFKKFKGQLHQTFHPPPLPPSFNLPHLNPPLPPPKYELPGQEIKTSYMTTHPLSTQPAADNILPAEMPTDNF